MRLWLDPDRMAARNLTRATSCLPSANRTCRWRREAWPGARAVRADVSAERARGRPAARGVRVRKHHSSGRGGSLSGSAMSAARASARDLLRRPSLPDRRGGGLRSDPAPTANALDVERSASAMERLSRNFPPGVKHQVAFNTTDVVEESINEVLKTLAEAIALVVLVIFVFLQTWRSTIIPAVTIPVSLIGAFAFTKLMGFSINTLTLFGIILATGIVVDDAIVVIENIERHIQQYGKSARQAASDAMREVFGAVVATGLVLIAVFVPVAFFPGTTGRLYAQFSMTIAFAVALSVFNAITLTPALSALLLERESHHKGRFFSFFEKVISAGTRGYVAGLRLAVAARGVVVLVFIGALGLTYWVYRTVPRRSFPKRTPATFSFRCRRRPARRSNTPATSPAEKIILSDPDVLALFSVMGFSFSGAAPNQGIMFARLKPFDERPGPEHGVQAVLGRISGPLFGLPGAIVVGFAPPSIPRLEPVRRFRIPGPGSDRQDITRTWRRQPRPLRGSAISRHRAGLFSSFTANDPSRR